MTIVTTAVGREAGIYPHRTVLAGRTRLPWKAAKRLGFTCRTGFAEKLAELEIALANGRQTIR